MRLLFKILLSFTFAFSVLAAENKPDQISDCRDVQADATADKDISKSGGVKKAEQSQNVGSPTSKSRKK